MRIPPQIAEQLQADHKNTEAMQQKVCAVAQWAQARTDGPSPKWLTSAALPGDADQEGRQHF
jgi:hypothetical protein